jgi:hypothetical protein
MSPLPRNLIAQQYLIREQRKDLMQRHLVGVILPPIPPQGPNYYEKKPKKKKKKKGLLKE